MGYRFAPIHEISSQLPYIFYRDEFCTLWKICSYILLKIYLLSGRVGRSYYLLLALNSLNDVQINEYIWLEGDISQSYKSTDLVNEVFQGQHTKQYWIVMK